MHWMFAKEIEQRAQAQKRKRAASGPTGLPAKMSEVILMDTLNVDIEEPTLIDFLTGRLDQDLAQLTNAERANDPDKQRTYLASSFRFRGYHSGGKGNDQGDKRDRRSGYGRRYGNVKAALDKWFAKHAADSRPRQHRLRRPPRQLPNHRHRPPRLKPRPRAHDGRRALVRKSPEAHPGDDRTKQVQVRKRRRW